MECRNCSKKINKEAKFCSNCGSSNEKASGEVIVPLEEKFSESEDSFQSSKEWNPMVVIGVFLAIVLLLVIALSSTSSTTPPTSMASDASTSPAELSSQDGQSTQASTTNSKYSSSLTSIIKEWRIRTAYVECDWNYNNNINQAQYFSDGGSGMLINFSDKGLTVITNKHVLDNPTYGGPTACYVKFPDDIGAYGPIMYPNITVDSTGIDDGMLENITDAPLYGSVSMSLEQRASPDPSICSSPEQIGDNIVVLGYPDYGSAINAIGNIEITATEGIISGKDGGYLTTSAQIEHGNSGGLAIDQTNDCYTGIPTAFVTGAAGSLGRILPASYIF